MKYQRKSFSVPMPGADVDWPFDKPTDPTDPPIAQQGQSACGECGRVREPGTPHIDLRDEEAKRPRKRVCFGKVIAG